MKNLFRLLLIIAFLGAGAISEAQQTKKIPVIGVLLPSLASDRASYNEAFLQGLRQLGYVGVKTFLLNTDTRKGKPIGSLSLRPS